MWDRKAHDPGRIARVYVRRPSGAVRVLVATRLSIADGMLSAEGRWSNRPHAEPRLYAWPTGRVLEVRREGHDADR